METTKYRAEHPSETSENIREGCSAEARYQVEMPHIQSVTGRLCLRMHRYLVREGAAKDLVLEPIATGRQAMIVDKHVLAGARGLAC